MGFKLTWVDNEQLLRQMHFLPMILHIYVHLQVSAIQNLYCNFYISTFFLPTWSGRNSDYIFCILFERETKKETLRNYLPETCKETCQGHECGLALVPSTILSLRLVTGRIAGTPHNLSNLAGRK